MVTISVHADRRDGHGVVCTAGERPADKYLRGSGHVALKAAGVEIVFYVEDLATVERLGLDIVEAAQIARRQAQPMRFEATEIKDAVEAGL